jgi:hypothetical protein
MPISKPAVMAVPQRSLDFAVLVDSTIASKRKLKKPGKKVLSAFCRL